MACGLGRLLPAGVAAVAVPVLLAGAGLAGAVGLPVAVAPAVGGPGTTFVISFTAPARTGVIGSIRLRDLLTATNASVGTGCLAQVNAPVSDARRGQRVHIRLDPTTLGGNWCAGSYHGSVRELQTAVCPHGNACPTYVRFVGTVARFSLVVRAPDTAGDDLLPPVFAGIAHAFACTPGPQRPGETTPYTLSWQPASDNRTPAAQIVYDIYYAHTPGGEGFTQPTWTTPPGTTSFRTPGLPSHGNAYFVVRARDTAGNQDTNTHEQKGIDPCY
jgi:hypothetical protein